MNIIDVVSRMEEAGAAVEDHCECGRPVGDHDYWEDKIYDVNGLRCQANWNREYRQSAIVTKRKRLEAKAAALERLLVTEPSADVIARIVQVIARIEADLHREALKQWPSSTDSFRLGYDSALMDFQMRLTDALASSGAPPTTVSEIIFYQGVHNCAGAPHRTAEGWRPIATAPKDKSWYLGWNRDCGCFIWRDGPGLITGEDPAPTHWQPLPPPPSSAPGTPPPDEQKGK